MEAAGRGTTLVAIAGAVALAGDAGSSGVATGGLLMAAAGAPVEIATAGDPNAVAGR